MKVNLFIAGACKSGTSFLHNFLGEQENICASFPKEPYFFELPKHLRDEMKYHNNYFKSFKGEKYMLDGRHRNMFFSWIPQDILNYNKDAKIIFILRNPVERAYSHWWMWYSRGITKSKFETLIKEEIKRLSSERGFMDLSPEAYIDLVKNEAPKGRMAHADIMTVVESGYYYLQIKRFKEIFNDEQILILDYEEIKDVTSLSEKLKGFLKVNINSINKEQIINIAPKHKKKSVGILRIFIPKKIKHILKHHFLKKSRLSKGSEHLLKEHYKGEIEKLVNELGVGFAKKWIK